MGAGLMKEDAMGAPTADDPLMDESLGADMIEAAPRARLQEIGLVHSSAIGSIWMLVTGHSLAEVLRPGYFNDQAEVGFQKHDRIFATTYGADGEPVYATLAVTEVPWRDGGRGSERGGQAGGRPGGRGDITVKVV